VHPSRTPLRAPAEVTLTGYVSGLLNRFFTRLADWIFPCRHHNLSLPYNGRQRCLDCGASRLYIFNSDFATGKAGIRTGPWRHDKPLPIQSAGRDFHASLTTGSYLRRPLNGREAILNPGADSPLFQPRPQTVIREIEDRTDAVIRRSQAVIRG